MTIIYDYQNFKKVRRPIILYSNHKYPHKKRYFPFLTFEVKEYFGHIKLFVFLLSPIIMAIVFWLILYGQNISLDYQIYKLKNSITQSEEKLADLQEELAGAESMEKIIKWAEENNFVKVNNVSYLNLKEENLAQSPFLRF